MSFFYWPQTSGITQAQVVAALQAVFPTNLLGSPKYHDAGTTNIGAAYVEVSGVGNGSIPAGTKKIQVSSIIGVPLNFGIGANAGAAVSMFNLVPGGGPVYFEYTFVAGAKLFVLTLDGTTVSGAGELFVVNFTG